MSGGEGLDLTFPRPTQPLSINRVKHWAQRRRLCQPWRDATFALAHNRRDGWGATPVTVQVVIPFDKPARRDAHNYTGTVVKAVVDGLVLARIVPDDTPEWVTVLDPELVVTPPTTPGRGLAAHTPPSVVVRVRPRATQPNEEDEPCPE